MKKHIIAFMLLITLCATTLGGCTIETPDEVANNADSQSASFESSTSSDDAQYFDAEDGDASAGMSDEDYEKYLSDANTYNAEDGELDSYLTTTVPDGMPAPVEWQDVAIDTSVTHTCTLTIECSKIFDNMDDFTTDKLSILPSDGVIYATRTVTFYAGESPFDVLLRETQNNRIHMEYNMVPLYNSNYIEGINNIYATDCGNLSGWMYSVNGWFPNYGCSRYLLSDGDAVVFHYTCDLGRDFGVTWTQ
ncbi:MAG: DUF4430 domain-containing protein [Actinobacteria bacterium]|nr:DUF4430 domain-containing protein [Actinomycetota bacterium]